MPESFQACVEYGFFYLINHGIEDGVFQKLLEESKKFFTLPLDEKMKLERNGAHSGYTPMYAETLDPSSKFKGPSLSILPGSCDCCC